MGCPALDERLAATVVFGAAESDGAPTEEIVAGGLFVLIGSVPQTSWQPETCSPTALGFRARLARTT